MTPRTFGALLGIAAIIAIALTTPGLPTWVVPIIGVVLAAIVALANRVQVKLARRVLAALSGKGAMTVTDLVGALGNVRRSAVVGALSRLRADGFVTREPIEQPGPDTHRYTAA